MNRNDTKYLIFKIVADGAISTTAIGEGRLLPFLIIDIEDHTEISDLIKLHITTPPGDTELQWVKTYTFSRLKSFILRIKFLKPMEILFGIEFDTNNQYALIDGIIQSKGFYLQCGKKGDKISDIKSESILVEVPSLGIEALWETFFIDVLKSIFRKRGLTKKESVDLAKQQIKSMREIWNIRNDK
jgi:hypothetical protein